MPIDCLKQKRCDFTRILVLSDIHGKIVGARKAIEAQKDATDVLFLGDGLRDIDRLSHLYPDRRFHTVKGNCDCGAAVNLIEILYFEGKRVFLTHGHELHVKDGLCEVLSAARSMKADILLFGHTHVPVTSYENGIYIMNPGSVSCPRGGAVPSYGVLDITPKGIMPIIIYL